MCTLLFCCLLLGNRQEFRLSFIWWSWHDTDVMCNELSFVASLNLVFSNCDLCPALNLLKLGIAFFHWDDKYMFLI